MTNKNVLPMDEDLRKFVAAAKTPVLLMMTSHITGNCELLQDRWQSDASMLPGGNLPAIEDKAARDACFVALSTMRESAVPIQARPSEELFESIVRWGLGDQFEAEDLPVLADFLVFDDEDPRAPKWTIDEIDSDRGFRVAIAGAGLSGLLLGLRLKQAQIPFVIYEREDDLGGTWKVNTYPGCRVDVPSHLYAYSFVAYDWSAYFAEQHEMLEYLQEFAKRYDLYSHIQFGSDVTHADWNDNTHKWDVHVRTGPDLERRDEPADLFVSAVGQLNKPAIPMIKGQDDYEGPTFHSAEWDDSVALAGKRVGIIGTGASGLQIIPAISEIAEKVTVFQRNAPWLTHTEELRKQIQVDERRAFSELPAYRAWYRLATFLPKLRGKLDAVTVDLDYPPTEYAVSAANARMREALEANLRSQIQDAPELEPIVIPNYPPGAKRTIRDDGTWIRTLRRSNVEVVTDSIVALTQTSVLTVNGDEHKVDAIIYSTGFNASEFLTPLDIHGRDGLSLHELWGDDPSSYFGLSVPGFPNFFCLYGPNTGVVVHANLVFFFECQVEHVMEATRRLLSERATSIELRPEALRAHAAEIDAANALRSWGWSGVSSWYKNRHGRSPIMWPLPTRKYWEGTKLVKDSAYKLSTTVIPNGIKTA